MKQWNVHRRFVPMNADVSSKLAFRNFACAVHWWLEGYAFRNNKTPIPDVLFVDGEAVEMEIDLTQ